MIKKALSYSIVGLLAVALVAGTGYILLKPTEVQGQGAIGSRGQGRGEAGQGENEALANEQGQGRARGSRGGYERSEATQGQGAFDGGAFGAGVSDGRGQDQGRNETVRTLFEWETLTGTVIAIDGEVTIQTTEGEMLVGMGQSAYWEDFELAAGDEIIVDGFYEDGEFKAGSVENLTTGETILLRDEVGRPMWSGEGRVKNQGSPGD